MSVPIGTIFRIITLGIIPLTEAIIKAVKNRKRRCKICGRRTREYTISRASKNVICFQCQMQMDDDIAEVKKKIRSYR